jgi:hypothetical protein
VKHAGAAALDTLEPLLAQLRTLPDLKETSRGAFYRRSKAFLHFHEDAAGLFADLRGESGDFDRFRVEDESERAAFLSQIRLRLA